MLKARIFSPTRLYSRTLMAETGWDHEIMFQTGQFELMSVSHSARSGGLVGISFQFSLT